MEGKAFFNTLNNFNENATLIKKMDTVGNFNHAVSIYGNCMLDYNG